MTNVNSASTVLRIPELAGLIFGYLDDLEIFRLQNLSVGSRRFYSDYTRWRSRLMHKDAYCGPTVKPVLPKEVDGDSADLKRVIWVYTSGLNVGEELPGKEYPQSGTASASQEVWQAPHQPYATSSSSSSAQSHGIGTSNHSASAPAEAEGPSRSSQAPRIVPHYGAPRPSSVSTQRRQMQGITLNWLLEAKFPKWKYYPISNMLGLEEDVPTRWDFINPDASHRALLLMTPPLSEVTVMDQQCNIFDINNPTGVTMGDVVDALMRCKGQLVP